MSITSSRCGCAGGGGWSFVCCCVVRVFESSRGWGVVTVLWNLNYIAVGLLMPFAAVILSLWACDLLMFWY